MNALAFIPSEPTATFLPPVGAAIGQRGSTSSSVSDQEAPRRVLRAKFAGRYDWQVKAREGAAIPSAIFTNQVAAELRSGADELADRQAEESKERIKAQTAAERRLEDLRELAAEEGLAVSRASVTALKAFLAAATFTKRPYITLLDNGNVRAFWEDKATGEQVGLQFRGDKMVQYVVFARRAEQGFIARSAGRDLATNMENQIEANGLRRLMA